LLGDKKRQLSTIVDYSQAFYFCDFFSRKYGKFVTSSQ